MPRPGYLTPSSFADLMTNGRSSDSMGKTALGLADCLAADMLGAERTETGSPPSCEWGLEHEWEAIQAYQDATMYEVRKPEFAVSSTHPYIGGTMDGLVGPRGGIEVKCPYNRIEHMYNVSDGRQVGHYIHQMQGYMFIYELDWIDFVSYDPRFPDPWRLCIRRVERDEEHIAQIIDRCEKVHKLALEIVAKFERLGAAC